MKKYSLTLLLFIGVLYIYPITNEKKSGLEMLNETNGFAPSEEIPKVSIFQLLSNPDYYHKKQVSITGISYIFFEEKAVYYSTDDYLYRILQNSLWLDITNIESNTIDFQSMNGHFVDIIGTFNKNKHGHMGLYSGSIENIIEFKLAYKRVMGDS